MVVGSKPMKYINFRRWRSRDSQMTMDVRAGRGKDVKYVFVLLIYFV